jgi:hypothetical protein
MISLRVILGTVLLSIAAVFCGCSQSTIATGQVTLDGKPLSKGQIVFQPADGNGPSSGATVVEGRYRVDLVPGKKVVQITGMRRLPFNLKDPQQAAFAAEAAKHGDTSGTYECVDLSLSNAEGNRVNVEVKLGSQALDFALNSQQKTKTAQNR